MGRAVHAIGHATADSVTRPYTKAPEPLFSTDAGDDACTGPGGQDGAPVVDTAATG